jgi:hypothetical protein
MIIDRKKDLVKLQQVRRKHRPRPNPCVPRRPRVRAPHDHE